MVEGLRGLGADIEETDDGFVVRGDGGRCAAARSTLAATTAWRCWARWRGWPPRRGSRCSDMEAAGVSYPGFEQDLAALLG